MPSVRCDRTCLSDRSLIGERFGVTGNGLTIVGPAVAACIVLRVCAADGHEVRDGTQAAGVGFGVAGWAFDTVCECLG